MMNSITNWNPLHELENMQDRILHAMQLRSSDRSNDHELSSVQWSPTVDVSEDDHEYMVKVEIPEVHKEDVHVTLDNGVLTITGERKFQKEDKHKKYHRIERSYGNFRRSLTMPDDVDPDKVSAEFKDGLLRVTLRKSEERKPRQIEILVN